MEIRFEISNLTNEENNAILLEMCNKPKNQRLRENSELVKGVKIKDAGYMLYESVASGIDVYFVIDLVKDLGLLALVVDRVVDVLTKYLKGKLKINGKSTTITSEDIRRIIREELEKSKDDPKGS